MKKQKSKQETRTRKKVPFWLQITAILLVGIIGAGTVFCVIRDKKAERFTVTFAYSDGTVIEQKTVKSGCGVFPPIPQNSESVFRGWSGGVNQVVGNTEVHPVFYDIVEDNLFYFDSVYVKEGKKCSLDLYVAGNVRVSSGDLTLSYDPEVLQFKGASEGSLACVEETESGSLHITFESENVITQKTLLSSLTFYAKKMDVYATEVQLKNNAVIIVENGQSKNADCATMNNKIYFLQEVRK